MKTRADICNRNWQTNNKITTKKTINYDDKLAPTLISISECTFKKNKTTDFTLQLCFCWPGNIDR